MIKVKIDTEYIKLDQFMKFQGIVSTGGEAKHFISEGSIKVNGKIELSRGKKLGIDDIIEFQGKVFKIV